MIKLLLKICKAKDKVKALNLMKNKLNVTLIKGIRNHKFKDKIMFKREQLITNKNKKFYIMRRNIK
jgi:hypothetical protein